MKSMVNTVVVVTGAAQGIGAELASAFAAQGAAVVATDIADCKETVSQITATGGRALGLAADVTNSEQLQHMVDRAEKAFGAIGVLINNASIFATLRLKSFLDITEEEWDRVMTVNVRGTFQAVKAVVPSMVRAGGGRIVNVSSGTFFYGAPGFMHYVASKGAVIGLTRCMARELGDKNILVNAIAPGLTESAGVRANPDFAVARAPTLAMRAIKRDMVPADLVGVVLFLASEANSFVTGQTLNIDGGRITY